MFKICSRLFIGLILLLTANLAFCVNLQEYYPTLAIDQDGRIETLNNEGGMAPSATGAEIWLLKDLQSSNKDLRVLEIGPAFGRLAIELFSQGFQGHYTALDLSNDHLQHMHHALAKFPNAQGKTADIIGRFPQATASLPDNSYDVIVVTHVFHFFKPEDFDKSTAELHRLLTPGGKIYITAKTPYSTRYKSFISVYEQRVNENNANPGFIDNVAAWVDPSTIDPARLQKLQGRHLYFFTKNDMAKIFAKNQFKIEKCEELPLGYKSNIWQAPKEYANREDVALVASK